MRRFERERDGQRVFWQAQREGRVIELRFGKVGQPPRQLRRTFESERDATAWLAQQEAARLSEGYVKVDANGVPSARRNWLRRFVCADQFAELTIDGAILQERTGVIGSIEADHRVRASEYGSPTEAHESADYLIAKLLARNYVLEVETDVPAGFTAAALPDRPARHASNPELEALCRASRDADSESDSREVFGVYADWLIENGDIRGELAALHLAGNEDDANALYRAHKRALHGGSADLDEYARVEWEDGFPRIVTIGMFPEDDQADLASVTATFLRLPFACFVDTIRIGLMSLAFNDWTETMYQLETSPVGPYVRDLELTFGDAYTRSADIADLSRSWSKLRSLESIKINGGGRSKLGRIVAPSLKVFERQTCGLTAAELRSICNAQWPKLESLVLWLGTPEGGGEVTIKALRPILDGKGLASLRGLGLVNSDLVEAMIPALARSKLLKQLATLDLSRGVMSADGAQALLDHARSFSHLTDIDVTDNYLTADTLARLRAALPAIRSVAQRASDDGGRYVVLRD